MMDKGGDKGGGKNGAAAVRDMKQLDQAKQGAAMQR